MVHAPASKESDPAATGGEPPQPRVADPLPLGIAGFAMTTFVLSVFNAGLWGGLEAIPAVFGLAIFYGGVAQFAAGMWEFVNKNTFGAAAFSSFGAFWLSFWFLETQVELPPDIADTATAVYLLGWAIFTAYMTIAALRVTVAVFIVFVLLTVTFVLLVFGFFYSSDPIVHVGGYVGIATAVAAWYTAFAGVTNATFKTTVLPVGPLG